MGNYKLYKIDCLLGKKRAACVGLPGLARGKGIILTFSPQLKARGFKVYTKDSTEPNV